MDRAALINALREFGYDMSPGVGDVRAAMRGKERFDEMREAFGEDRYLDAAGKGAEGLAEYISTVPGIGELAGAGLGVIRGIRGYNPARAADELAAAMDDASDAAKTQITQVGKGGEPTGTGSTYAHWLRATPEDATVLDFGAGKGQGIPADRVGTRRHEPFPQGWDPDYREIADIPASEFDTVMNNATLNVVPPEVQREMAQGMLRAAEPGGEIISSSRSTIPAKTATPVEGLEGVRVPGRGYQEAITPEKYVRAFGDNVDYAKLPKGKDGKPSGDMGFTMKAKPVKLPEDVLDRLQNIHRWDPEVDIGRVSGAGYVDIHRDYALHRIPADKLREAAVAARKKGLDDWNIAKYHPKLGTVTLYRGIPTYQMVGPDHPNYADLVRNSGYSSIGTKRYDAAARRGQRAVDEVAARIQKERGY